jgi:ATP-dependent helicase/nuclease subunit A
MDPVGLQSEETPIAKYITRLGNECAAEETKRLLYVAATRARERLYLVTTMPEHGNNPATGSMLSLLPEKIRAQFPEQPDPTSVEEAPSRHPNSIRRLPVEWALPACPAPLHVDPRYPAARDVEPRQHTFVRVGEDLRRIGTVTHRLLQQMGEEGIEAWPAERIPKLTPAIRALLVQQGIRESELVASERRVLEALRNTVADANGRWILRKRPESNNEFALSAVLDGVRHSIKVDRTFVDGDTRWLVDYKTSDREGTITENYVHEQIDKYREDLQRYARILHAYDGRQVKGGLYFPLLQRWCEVDFLR